MTQTVVLNRKLSRSGAVEIALDSS